MVKECGRSAGSGTFSLSATALTTTTGGSSPVRALAPAGVERGDAQADEVRRRREVRLVGHAAAGVEAHGPRREPRAQVGGEVARLAVVAGHHERRAVGRRAVGQRGDEVGRSDCDTNARPPSAMSAAPSGCSARRERSGLRAIRAGEATAHEGRAAVSIHCSERAVRGPRRRSEACAASATRAFVGRHRGPDVTATPSLDAACAAQRRMRPRTTAYATASMFSRT